MCYDLQRTMLVLVSRLRSNPELKRVLAALLVYLKSLRATMVKQIYLSQAKLVLQVLHDKYLYVYRSKES